jgi:hypothetical protein
MGWRFTAIIEKRLSHCSERITGYFMLKDIWMSIRWRKVKINGKDQFRLLPVYSKDNQFKRCLSI